MALWILVPNGAGADEIEPQAAGVALSAVSAAPPVRVLLLESSGAVRLGGGAAGPAGVTVEPAGAGLRVGGRAVGPVWRLSGGPLEAAGLRVRGALEVRRAGPGLRVTNRVDLEDYLVSTVAREVYPGWEPEMLKAQAVVARTYALHERGRRAREPYDLRAGTRGQVYGGIDAETEAARAAVANTRGQFLAWRGQPILAVYHSAAGGRTASSEEVWGRPLPYLVSVPVPDEEDSPDTYWRASVSGTTLGRALAPVGIRIGAVRELAVLERSASGRVLRLQARGESGSEEVRGRALRQALGESVIRSTLFEVRRDGEAFVFAGSGHGHGVGMSQWGAQAMAKGGARYDEILAAFYPGTHLGRGGP